MVLKIFVTTKVWLHRAAAALHPHLFSPQDTEIKHLDWWLHLYLWWTATQLVGIYHAFHIKYIRIPKKGSFEILCQLCSWSIDIENLENDEGPKKAPVDNLDEIVPVLAGPSWSAACRRGSCTCRCCSASWTAPPRCPPGTGARPWSPSSCAAATSAGRAGPRLGTSPGCSGCQRWCAGGCGGCLHQPGSHSRVTVLLGD